MLGKPYEDENRFRTSPAHLAPQQAIEALAGIRIARGFCWASLLNRAGALQSVARNGAQNFKGDGPLARTGVPMSCGWAIQWTRDCRLDGFRQFLTGMAGLSPAPDHLAGYTILVFKSRAAALAHIETYYAYLRKRPDLRGEPHGWRMPKAVRVNVTIAIDQ